MDSLWSTTFAGVIETDVLLFMKGAPDAQRRIVEKNDGLEGSLSGPQGFYRYCCRIYRELGAHILSGFGRASIVR